MNLVRDPRTKDVRQDERIEDARDPIVFSDVSGFNLPQSFLDAHPDKSFCFQAYESAGYELVDEYDLAVSRRGYTACDVNKYPTLKKRHVISPFERKNEDNFIRYRKHVLLERPKEIHDKEIAFYDQKNKEQEIIRDMNRAPGSNPTVFANERHYGNKRIV